MHFTASSVEIENGSYNVTEGVYNWWVDWTGQSTHQNHSQTIIYTALIKALYKVLEHYGMPNTSSYSTSYMNHREFGIVPELKITYTRSGFVF